MSWKFWKEKKDKLTAESIGVDPSLKAIDIVDTMTTEQLFLCYKLTGAPQYKDVISDYIYLKLRFEGSKNE